MKTNIIVKFNIEGFHNWPDATTFAPEVGFLSDRHRHIFFFELEKTVEHNDRDIEIILFKREVISWLFDNYSTNREYLEFGAMSCEMIGTKLVEQFDLDSCKVLEDNENGSITKKISK